MMSALNIDIGRIKMSLRTLFTVIVSALAMCAGVARAQASGTGFFITTDGYFVTNHHVVKGSKSIVIRTVNGKRYPAEIVRIDAANDLAILKAEGTFRALPVQNSQGVRRGDRVFTLGFPNPLLQGIEPKFTDGVISSLTGSRDKPNNFQMSVPIQPGNSGGPLISSLGNVVGIVVSSLNPEITIAQSGSVPENVNYAVKSNYLVELISTLSNVRTGMMPIRSKSPGDMSDLAALAEASVGLVSIELILENKSQNANPQPVASQQQLPSTNIGSQPNLPSNFPVSSNFPDRPIKIIIPYVPGAQTDMLARVLAKNAAQITGHNFTIENRPGSNGAFGAELVQRSIPDGYTLLLTNEVFAILPSLNSRTLYDADQGFTPVSMLKANSLVLVANTSMKLNSLTDLVKLAKSNPGQFKYASTGMGSVAHFAGEEFRRTAGINLVHVPYKGLAPALSDLLAGNVNMMFGSVQNLLPYIESGKLQAIAVTLKRRELDLPDIPTFEESGIPSIPVITWSAILAPANTPTDVINKLNQIISRTLNSPDLKVTTRAATPEVTNNFIKNETAKFRRLTSIHNIRAD